MSTSLNSVILCPTARLVRSIQSDIAHRQLQSGHMQWQTAAVFTLSQWLSKLIEQALLTAEINDSPTALSAFSEQLLWQEIITESLQKNAFGDLFDVSGLASAAIEANRYQIVWNLHLPREHQAEESRQFVQWQRSFQQRCRQLNVLESVRYIDWQLDCLSNPTIFSIESGKLPTHIEFAGFDQTAPQEQRLREILLSHGVQVSEYKSTNLEPALAQHFSLENQEAEYRAAVAWAKQKIEANPSVKLAIVAPQLSEIRTPLVDLLDDVLCPASLRPKFADSVRDYNLSLGTALSQQPIIQAALNLLRLFNGYQLQQTDVSSMLLSPFWSADQQEADARAMLDANMREKLPAQFTLPQFIAFIKTQLENGLSISRLLIDITAAIAFSSVKKVKPSQILATLESMLAALNWPGERSLNSIEFQAINAWQKALQQFKSLDLLGKNVSMTEAVQLLQQICTAQLFQPETAGEPPIQILGIMEALSAPVDAMWVLQMNDHIWPPPARPNALLPAFIQRAAQVPNADNHIQAAFATSIQQRLLHSAQTIIFSSSKTEGESQLRASPLMQDISKLDANIPLAETLAEQLSQLNNQHLTHIDDHLAPAVQAGEHVSGGTGLIKAQAICPAWAFYRFRLGAKALKTPNNGLDNMQRGLLVHDVLEQFWRKRHFADLRDMSAADLAQALSQAIRAVLTAFSTENSAISPAAVLELEQERLHKLIGDWLQYEKERGIPFEIIACEAEKQIDIRGIEVTLKIDRIHALETGKIALIDYKTGQKPDMKSWGETRITEPQLPIYAVFGAESDLPVTEVQFAMVKMTEHAFLGVSEAGFETEADKRKPTFLQNFDDWPALLTHWKNSIEAIAKEIKAGEAAVRFDDERLLMYCEVVPLLRLPERQLQFERFETLNLKP